MGANASFKYALRCFKSNENTMMSDSLADSKGAEQIFQGFFLNTSEWNTDRDTGSEIINNSICLIVWLYGG